MGHTWTWSLNIRCTQQNGGVWMSANWVGKPRGPGGKIKVLWWPHHFLAIGPLWTDDGISRSQSSYSVCRGHLSHGWIALPGHHWWWKDGNSVLGLVSLDVWGEKVAHWQANIPGGNIDSYWLTDRLEGDLVEYNFKIIDVWVNFPIAVTGWLAKAVRGRKGLFELMPQRIIVHDGGDWGRDDSEEQQLPHIWADQKAENSRESWWTMTFKATP